MHEPNPIFCKVSDCQRTSGVTGFKVQHLQYNLFVVYYNVGVRFE